MRGAPAKSIASLIVAVASLALSSGGSARAEDGVVYGLRQQCIDLVGGGYAAIYGGKEYGDSRYRTNRYINCMRSHGLAP